MGPATMTCAGRGGRTEPGREAPGSGGAAVAATTAAAKSGSVRTVRAVIAAGEPTEAGSGDTATEIEATGSCAVTGVAAAVAAAVLAVGIAFMSLRS